MVQKRLHPRFNVLNHGRKERKRVKARWRLPRGQDNKKKRGHREMGASPRAGYGNPASLRHLHPLGKREALVFNTQELVGLKDVLVRIGGGVGKRKRQAIQESAKKLSLQVLN